MKKIIAILLVAVMLLSLVPAPATATSYSDILGIDETQYDMESYYQHLWSNYNSNVHGLLWDAVCGKQYYVYPQVVEEIGNDGWIDFASNITEEQLTRDRYIEILSNLLVMMDYNTKDLIAEQVNADTTKTFRDYVVDVTGILTQTISLNAAFGSHVTKQMEKISTAMNLTWGFADFTINTIETYESLDRTLRQYENHQEFLSAIANNTSDSTLKEAALALSDTVDKAFYCKVNAVADTASDLAGYLGNDVFFDTIVLEYMASDASVLGLSQDDVAVLGVLKSAYEYMGTLQLAADIGVFAGDAIIGISDVMNRFNEMRALTEVRNALIQQMTSYRDSITSVNDIEEIGKLCSLLKNLIYVNFRGEYCAHEMCVQDAQLYSLVIKINGQAETNDRVYEQAKENTEIYSLLVDMIFPELEFYRTETVDITKYVGEYDYVEYVNEEINTSGQLGLAIAENNNVFTIWLHCWVDGLSSSAEDFVFDYQNGKTTYSVVGNRNSAEYSINLKFDEEDIIVSITRKSDKYMVIPEGIYKFYPLDTSVSVTDAYVDAIIDGEWVYCYHIPQINPSDEKFKEVNNGIYNGLYLSINEDAFSWYNECGWPSLTQLTYEWGQKDDIISIVTQVSYENYTYFDVYNISCVTGKDIISNRELFSAYHMSEEEFYELAKAAIQEYWEEEKKEHVEYVPREVIQSCIDKTLAEENIRLSIPYINSVGELCIVTRLYWFAGGGTLWFLLNTNGNEEGWIECTMDHATDN